MKERLLLTVLGLGLAACGPSVADVCEALDEECAEFPADQCVADGERLEERAEEAECEDELDEYISCVDNALCNWYDACSQPRGELEACVGQFE